MKIPRAEPEITIQNVVASVSLNQKIDLNAVQAAFSEVEYKPKEFPGLVFRLKKPKTALLIFSSGKMVCTGAKSEKAAMRAVDVVVKKLRKAGIIIRGGAEVKIQNIVASGNLHGEIDLERAQLELENTMYEPEQFPGLIYRMRDPKVVMLLFASGKLVCTGGKSEEQVREAVKKLHAVLDEKELIYYRGEAA